MRFDSDEKDHDTLCSRVEAFGILAASCVRLYFSLGWAQGLPGAPYIYESTAGMKQNSDMVSLMAA